jgi:hypothetical protein
MVLLVPQAMRHRVTISNGSLTQSHRVDVLRLSPEILLPKTGRFATLPNCPARRQIFLTRCRQFISCRRESGQENRDAQNDAHIWPDAKSPHNDGKSAQIPTTTTTK